MYYSFIQFTKVLSTIICLTAGTIYGAQKEKTVRDVMDRVITDLYKTSGQEELAKISLPTVMSLFSKEELEVLSTQHLKFTSNVPVVVSVMINKAQGTIPFWLSSGGFSKTSLTMKNEQTTYEVWRKDFEPGEIGLGVNGFENGLALHYFVSVAPKNNNEQMNLTDFFPVDQKITILKNGASVYRDWDELVLSEVPAEMTGQKLLMTTRGRAAESHLVGAFRSSPYPSSGQPDQVVLTWSSDPAVSMDIQWRTNATTNTPGIRYRVAGTTDESSSVAEKVTLEDRMLMNDRYSNHYTARIRNLKPGTTYQYLLGNDQPWKEAFSFTTAAQDSSFSFLWFGDTHYSEKFKDVLTKGISDHPDAVFFSIVGDLVSDGLNRDQWDALYHHSKDVACRIPFMSVPGNHDNRAGLGAKLYCDLFSYPKNGPDGVPKEQTYAFTYKNALFLMIDATSPIDAQTKWIEDQLSKSNARWKIAMFHFSPYNWEEPYLDIQQAWIPLFDKYHADMVLGGHLHYYMRSKPMKGGKTVESYREGTAYIISVGIPGSDRPFPEEPYAAVRKGKGHLYQYVKINGNSLHYESVNAKGEMIDSFDLKK